MIPILSKGDAFLWSLIRMVPIVIIVFLFVKTPTALKIDSPSVDALIDERISPEILQFFGNFSDDCTSGNCDKMVNKLFLFLMQKNINLDIDPCTDFYEYACGNWGKFIGYSSLYEDVIESHNLKFVQIFKRWQLEDNNEVIQQKNIVQKKLATYYKSCQTNTESALLNNYLQYMREEEKLWQFGQTTDWVIALGRLGRFGFKTLFIEYDIQVTSSKVQLTISPHSSETNLTWTEDIWSALKEYTKKGSEELRTELKDFEGNLLKALEGNEANDKIYAFETKVSGFVSRFFEALEDDGNGDDDESEERTVAQLMAEPECKFDWITFLSNLLDRLVRPDEKIIVKEFNAIKRVVAFLRRSNSETIQLYTMARFLQYVNETVVYNANGEITPIDCVDHMQRTFPVLMNYVYDLEYYSKIRTASNAVIHHIFESLRNEFRLILKENSMRLKRFDLDSLYDRINNMRLSIGDFPENASSMDYYNYAKRFGLREDDFAWNHLQALRITTEYAVHLIGMENVDGVDPLYIYHSYKGVPQDESYSPFYMQQTNVVTFSFVYLQWPFYSEKFWDTLLYGELANTLGHEILHGFDSEALNDDSDSVSKLTNTIEWNPHYAANIACLQNGTEHLPERIADVSGVKLVIRAFREQITKTRDNMRLFFITFAQYYCETKESLDAFYSDTHDKGKLRVNYVAANIPEFADSFGCPKQKEMNPKKRCHLW